MFLWTLFYSTVTYPQWTWVNTDSENRVLKLVLLWPFIKSAVKDVWHHTKKHHVSVFCHTDTVLTHLTALVWPKLKYCILLYYKTPLNTRLRSAAVSCNGDESDSDPGFHMTLYRAGVTAASFSSDLHGSFSAVSSTVSQPPNGSMMSFSLCLRVCLCSRERRSWKQCMDICQ